MLITFIFEDLGKMTAPAAVPIRSAGTVRASKNPVRGRASTPILREEAGRQIAICVRGR